MGVILSANYRIFKDNKRQTVPAPVDLSTPFANWWYDHIAWQAPEIRRAGFSAVNLPPFTKAQGGSANDADGYGKTDDYDIGSKNQCYSIPTRFGTAQQLRDCIATLHANGLHVYGDVILHQYDGGRGGVYRYPSSTGKTNGRFPKDPPCFTGAPPRVPVDPVFNTEGNFPFGDGVSVVNSKPDGYMAQGLIDSTDWLVRTTGVDGFRIDDTKGMNTSFINRLIRSKSMADKFAYGECFSGNPDELNRWVWGTEIQGRASTLDFTMKWNLQDMANNNSRWWMGHLDSLGYCSLDNYHAVTFCESHDTDVSPGQQLVWNKALAYAVMLTFPGYPMVYYRDWSDDPGCYNLKDVISNLIWIHENICNGPKVTRWGNDPQVYIHERLGFNGHPGCLAAFNNDQWNEHTRTVQTAFGPNQRVHEYTGKYNDIWTDSRGNLTFTIPRNVDGMSYLVFGLPQTSAWMGPARLPESATTQTFFGAADLDIMPARNNDMTWAGTVLSEASRHVTLTLRPKPPGAWTPGATVTALLFDSNKMSLGGVMATEDDPTPNPADIAVPTAQRVSLCVVGSGLPNEGWPFELTARYTAPKSPI